MILEENKKELEIEGNKLLKKLIEIEKESIQTKEEQKKIKRK